jgi:hypothetical protein
MPRPIPRPLAPCRSCSAIGTAPQRDLRVINDRQYYVDGEDQLWRIRGS